MNNTIAFFDFDGTITKEDSLIQFIKYYIGNYKFYLGLLTLSPILIAYKLKLIPNYKAKEKMLKYFFLNLDDTSFKKIADDYSLNYIDRILREKAIEKINWHKERGDKIIIVSASIECWLKPWCNKNNVELLATKLEIIDNKITGNLLTKNCYGSEKVNRIKEKYNLDEYEYIYAYGDTRGDMEMLKLASKDKRFYRCF